MSKEAPRRRGKAQQIDNPEAWTDKEIDILRKRVETYGKRWETVVRGLPDRTSKFARKLYYLYVECDRVAEYRTMRGQGMNHAAIMDAAEARESETLVSNPPPPKQQPVRARKRGQKKGNRTHENLENLPVYHSDEEIVVVGQDTDDILFHQSSTRYSPPVPEASDDQDNMSDVLKLDPEVVYADEHPSSPRPKGTSMKRKAGSQHEEVLDIPIVGQAVAIPVDPSATRASSRKRGSKSAKEPRTVSRVTGEGSDEDLLFPDEEVYAAYDVQLSTGRLVRPPARFEAGPAIVRGQPTSSDPATVPEGDGSQRGNCYCGKNRDFAFFVACDSCDQWFHGCCIGVDTTFVSRLEGGGLGYYCTQCRILHEHGKTVHRVGGDWRVRPEHKLNALPLFKPVIRERPRRKRVVDPKYEDPNEPEYEDEVDDGMSSQDDEATRSPSSNMYHGTANLTADGTPGKVVHVTRFSRQAASLRARKLAPTDFEVYQAIAKQRRFFTRIGWPKGSVPGPVQGVPYSSPEEGPHTKSPPQTANAGASQWSKPAFSPGTPHGYSAAITYGGGSGYGHGIGAGAVQMRAAQAAQDAYRMASPVRSPPVAPQAAPQVLQYGGTYQTASSFVPPTALPYAPFVPQYESQSVQAIEPVTRTALTLDDYPPLICVPHFTELVPPNAKDPAGLSLGPLQNPPGAVMRGGLDPVDGIFEPCRHVADGSCANLTTKGLCQWHDTDRAARSTDSVALELTDREALIHHVQLESQRVIQQYASSLTTQFVESQAYTPPVQPQMDWRSMAMSPYATPHMQVMLPQTHPHWPSGAYGGAVGHV